MPERFSFTQRSVEQYPPPDKGRTYVYDAKTPALALCVTATGSRTFYRYGRVDGRPVRFLLGKFPALTVEDARKLCAAVSGDIAKGKNPQLRRQLGRQRATFGELFQRFMRTHVTPKRSARTATEYQRQYDAYLQPWANRPAGTITTTDVEDLHAKLGTENGKYLANRVLALVSAVYVKTRQRKNPASGIERFPEESRERFILPDEMPRFLAALDEDPSPNFADVVRVSLFTGARIGAVLAMEWKHLQLDAGLWHCPSTKGKAVTIILPVPVVAILARRQVDLLSERWVFPSRGGKHLGYPQKQWRALCKRAGLEDLRPHDLRRSQGSWMACGGESLTIIGKALGHSAGSSATAVYARLHNDPVRQAVEAATAAMISTTAMVSQVASTEGAGNE